ncbi:MAG: MFS transporter, partial [Actinomycetota bacterium]
GNASGPVIAGALGEIDWRYVFFLNVPIALIAMVAVITLVKLPRDRVDEHIDYVGTGLLSISLLSLLTTLTLAPNVGYGEPGVIAGFVVFAVFMVAFVWWLRRVGEAGLIPTSVAKNRPFIRACVAILLMSGLFFAAVFYFPQFFQKILGEDTLVAGLMLLPFVVVFAGTSFVEPWLVGKIGTKAVLSAGAAALFLGALLTVVIVDDNAEWAAFVPGMIALGIGVGLFYSAITNAALDLLPPDKSSLAGGLLYMFQIAGGAVGLALTTTVFLATSSREIDDAATDIGVQLSTGERNDIQGVLAGTDTSQQLLDQYSSQASQLTEIVRDSFVTGMRWGFGFNALLSLVGLLVVVWAVGGPPSMMFRDRDADGTDEAEAEDAAADEAGAL